MRPAAGSISAGGQQFEQRGAVTAGLGFADARDVEQLVHALRPARGEFLQRAVVEDDVGRTVFLLHNVVNSGAEITFGDCTSVAS
jgi:hypothetical protein